jgi:hypothetical protein
MVWHYAMSLLPQPQLTGANSSSSMPSSRSGQGVPQHHGQGALPLSREEVRLRHYGECLAPEAALHLPQVLGEAPLTAERPGVGEVVHLLRDGPQCLGGPCNEESKRMNGTREDSHSLI